ncbi:MAG: hypothetical protein HW421_790 [Ignavibacteria bacterium]|nr:hypothetical protein [Ignavibacteria bacterium]
MTTKIQEFIPKYMKFFENQYYHIYNRTNNDEALFNSKENYLYFLKKYRFYLDAYLETIAYCLMPTHFHFLVKVKNLDKSSDDFQSSDDYSKTISNQIAILLRSYSRAFNNMWGRHGNLFNQKTNAKLIENVEYYIALATYIHQNPVRSKLVSKSEEWEFSSYQDYIELRKGSLPKKELLLGRYTIEELKEITNKIIESHPMTPSHRMT